MPTVSGQLRNNRGALAYEVSGQGRCVIFCHALATNLRLWDDQVAALNSEYQIITYDLRGHGNSEAATDGDYSFGAMARDVIALMDHLRVEQASVVGISVGGEIAQVLAAEHPRRISKLMLSSTACHTSQERARMWETRIEEAQANGMRSVASSSVSRWFSKEYHHRRPECVELWRERIAATVGHAYIGIARSIQSMDLRSKLSSLRCETHVVCGSEDENTGPVVAVALAELIAGATTEVISGAGHFPNVEVPEKFNLWLLSRLSRDFVGDLRAN